MSTSQSQSDTPATEEMVAYLDGELAPDECRRVERRLASDADYRRQLGELERAWTALESLPASKVDDDFARTTIEMVAVDAVRQATKQSAGQTTAGRRRAYLAVAVGLTLAATAFAVVRTIVPGRNDALVADLPVIAQMDVLTQIEDVEFLRGLSRLDVDRWPQADGASTGGAALSARFEDWETPAGRHAWIEQLPAENKAELAAKFERFANLSDSPDAQDRLRRLERDIAEADDRVKLQKTLAEYAQWIQSRTPGEQMELRELSTGERLRRVESLVRQSARSARRQLSLEDEKALQDAILEFVEQRKQDFQEEIGRRGNPDLRRRIAGQSTAVVALAIIGREMQDDDRRRRLQNRLTSRLSPEAQEYFEDLSGRQSSRQLWQWMMDALRPRFGPQEMERFFAEELDNDQREYLLGLPQPEMEEQLQQWYTSSQVGLRDLGWRGRFGRGGPNWDREGDRGRRGPRRDFDERGFGGGPFPRGPGGPGGPPPNGPPREWRDWQPGDEGPPPPPREFGPPPPPDGPPMEEAI